MVGIEKSRNKHIRCPFRRETSENFCFGGWSFCDKEKPSSTMAMTFFPVGIDFLVLILVLLFIFCKVVLNFGELQMWLVSWYQSYFSASHRSLTSANIEYQCASDMKRFLLLSTFITPID